MSAKRKVEVYLDEDVFARVAAAAEAASLSLEAVLAEAANDYFLDDSLGDEVLRRANTPQTSISLEEMRRRLTT